MVLDKLKDQPQTEQKKVLSRLGDYCGVDVQKFDNSFEGIELVYLLEKPNTGRYWKSLKRHA
jgi:hypothetical protein